VQSAYFIIVTGVGLIIAPFYQSYLVGLFTVIRQVYQRFGLFVCLRMVAMRPAGHSRYLSFYCRSPLKPFFQGSVADSGRANDL